MTAIPDPPGVGLLAIAVSTVAVLLASFVAFASALEARFVTRDAARQREAEHARLLETITTMGESWKGAISAAVSAASATAQNSKAGS